MRGHRAVFLDRDGTICEEVGYLSTIEKMRLLPRAGAAIKRLNEGGFKTIVITNQSGVARGFFTESRLEEVHRELRRQLGEQGATLDGIYYCPHHPAEGDPPYLKECTCRKPLPGLLFQAAADFGLDLKTSFMVGDHSSDVACGHNAGAKAILVLTGHGDKTLEGKRDWPFPPSFIAGDLFEAVEWIFSVADRP
jgi:D-glycero-D-manno-heptose 1,7-bisphosphate phosphatase